MTVSAFAMMKTSDPVHEGQVVRHPPRRRDGGKVHQRVWPTVSFLHPEQGVLPVRGRAPGSALRRVPRDGRAEDRGKPDSPRRDSLRPEIRHGWSFASSTHDQYRAVRHAGRPSRPRPAGLIRPGRKSRARATSPEMVIAGSSTSNSCSICRGLGVIQRAVRCIGCHDGHFAPAHNW
jgi:hypothetical protein